MTLIHELASKVSNLLCPPIQLPEIPFKPAKTIDLTARCWGRNYEVMSLKDEGRRLHVAMWLREKPEVGDYLILNDAPSTTRYRIEKLEWCRNPGDMYFADLTFAPRPRP